MPDYIERTYGGGTHCVLTEIVRDPMAESARFVALEREASRLLDRAIDEKDPQEELRLIREARRLRGLLAR